MGPQALRRWLRVGRRSARCCCAAGAAADALVKQQRPVVRRCWPAGVCCELLELGVGKVMSLMFTRLRAGVGALAGAPVQLLNKVNRPTAELCSALATHHQYQLTRTEPG